MFEPAEKGIDNDGENKGTDSGMPPRIETKDKYHKRAQQNTVEDFAEKLVRDFYKDAADEGGAGCDGKIYEQH